MLIFSCMAKKQESKNKSKNNDGNCFQYAEKIC